MAYFLDIALTLEESCRTSMHFVEVGQILYPSDSFFDQEAEIFVKWDRGGRCKIKCTLGITHLKSLLEGGTFPRRLLSKFFQRLRFRDAHFGITDDIDFVFTQQLYETARLGSGEVSEPDGVCRRHRPVDRRAELLVMRQSCLQLLDAGVQIFDSLPVDESELIHIVKVKAGVSEDALSHVVELMLMMEVFDGLLEADGDEQAEDDGGDVDEEVAPGGGGVVRRVDV